MLTPGPCRAGVVGSPIAHSLSPALHRAAYRALGLDGWTFDAAEVTSGDLGSHVGALGPEWAGLAVTMPLKEEALDLGATAGEAALLAGAANTLVRRGSGWFADNTDVYGIVAALTGAGLRAPRRAVVLGAGATARSTLVALRDLGVVHVELRVRSAVRDQTRALVERLGLGLSTRPLAEPLTLDTDVVDVVVSTLPASAVVPEPVLNDGDSGRAPVVMDVAYAPWPSGFATAVVRGAEGRVPVVRGTEMLLHQAVRQVALMTGHDGPVTAMREALEGETR